MIQIKRSALLSEINGVVTETHQEFRGSLENATLRVRAVPNHDWGYGSARLSYLGRFPMIYENHNHGDDYVLIRHGETFAEAAERYCINRDSYCSNKVEAIRQELRTGKEFPPIMIQAEARNPIVLGWIDGLHRTMAMLLEEVEETELYLAQPKIPARVPAAQPIPLPLAEFVPGEFPAFSGEASLF